MAADKKKPVNDLDPGRNPGEEDYQKTVDKRFSADAKRQQKSAAEENPESPKSFNQEELSEAESSTAAPAEFAVNVGQGGKSSGKKRRSILHSNRARVIGGALAVGLATIVIYIFTLISGPLQFIHL